MGVLINLFFGVFLVAVLMVEDVEKQSNFDLSFLSFFSPHKPSERQSRIFHSKLLKYLITFCLNQIMFLGQE